MYHQTKRNTKIVTGKFVQVILMPLAMEKQEIKVVNAYIS